MAARVDLNADLGELPGDAGAMLDLELLDVVTSANIACGGHAGDPGSMRRVADAAAQRQVAIGAHVSYPDREHFGRLDLAFTPQALLAALRSQVEALLGAAAEAGSAVRYIKAHGALYNASVVSDAPATLLVELAREYGLPILTQSEGRLWRIATGSGVTVYSEFFADRAYEATGRLRARSETGAVITHDATVVARVLTAIRDQQVTSHDGATLAVAVHSVCLHGDTPGAHGLARTVRAALDAEPLLICPFVEVLP